MREEWVLSIRDQCTRARIPFFFKQWGGVQKRKHGRELRGETYDEFPTRQLATATERVPHTNLVI
jgi:protein gp37